MRNKWKSDIIEHIEEHLNSIEQEIIEMRKAKIYNKVINKDKNQKAWDEFITLSDEISEQWDGVSAVEEIRLQRRK
jgi:hypothetical protein